MLSTEKSPRATPGIKVEVAEDGTLWSGGVIQDWDGNVLWDFYPPRDVGISVANMPFHHDMKRIWNKKLNQWTQLIVSNRSRTQAEAATAGGDPATPLARLQNIDYIIEVNMARQIVWQWDFWTTPARPVPGPAFASMSRTPREVDVYWMTDNQRPRAGRDSWPTGPRQLRGLQRRDRPRVINPKHFSQMFVIDHDKTFVSATDFAANKAAAAGPDGDIIYRWGNPAMYKSGAAPGLLDEGDQQGYGWHNIHFIWPYHWQRPKLPTDTWPDPATYTAALPGAGTPPITAATTRRPISGRG
jgi:hypothetical protein